MLNMKNENKGGFIWEFGFIISSKRFIFECKIVFIHFCKKKICSVFHCENSEVQAIYTIFEDCRMLWWKVSLYTTYCEGKLKPYSPQPIKINFSFLILRWVFTFLTCKTSVLLTIGVSDFHVNEIMKFSTCYMLQNEWNR